MREILFRGKRLYDGKWLYGNLVIDNNSKPHIISPEYFYEDGHHLQYYDDTDKPVFIDIETVGQYTSLTDKNGTKIFEGDIVKVTDKYNHSVVYVLDYRYAAFTLKQKGVDYSIHFTDILSRFHSIEVIGNIHDNPELLEGGADNG